MNNKQGNNQSINASVNTANQTKQEYNQQVPVSSYYLLHGKYNSKGKKTQSSSVKATDLGGPSGQSGQTGSGNTGKNSLMALQQ